MKEVLDQVRNLLPNSLSVEQTYTDLGYKGHKVKDVKVHMITGRKKMRWKTSRLRFWLKRRVAIEPIIGHMKSDGGVRRSHLVGKDGDRACALLTGVGV